MPNLTDAEFAALTKAAARNASTDVEDIAKRPYQTIKAPDGQTLCVPPSEGGPLTIGGLHPNDHFGADDKGLASKGF